MRAARDLGRLAAAAAAALLLLAAAPAHAALTLVPAYTDSSADPVAAHSPIYLTAPRDDSSRLFIAEKSGRVRVAVNGVVQDAPFLDISSQVQSSGLSEAGFLSMAFAPDYATSGKFYVYYVAKPTGAATNGDIHIDEFTRSSANPNVADPASQTQMLVVPHGTYSNHYGGQLQFGPDGKLYAATGDGGSANDPGNNAQNPASLLGKLLTIDPAHPGTAHVVAIGLRNPFRFSFDRGADDIVIGDVGQDRWEEVDWAPVASLEGGNFGWKCFEGNEQLVTPCTLSGTYIPPVFTYPNPPGSTPSVAITGGVVVRDTALGSLYGRYVYSDFYAGRIHSQVLATPNSTDDRIEADLPKVAELVAFGQDADNHVYVVSLAGSVYRIACSGSCSADANPGPPPQPSTGGNPVPAPAAPPPAQKDTTPPHLRIRAAHRQRLLRLRVVRLSLACDERCTVRVAARTGSAAARGRLLHLLPGRRQLLRLALSKRQLRSIARGRRVVVSLRARDAAGNLRTATLRVAPKR